MPQSNGTLGDTLWREGVVRCVLLRSDTGAAVEVRSEHGGVLARKLTRSASPQGDPDSFCPDALLTKPCLLPTLLAAARLLLRRVLPATVSRPPAAPTA